MGRSKKTGRRQRNRNPHQDRQGYRNQQQNLLQNQEQDQYENQYQDQHGNQYQDQYQNQFQNSHPNLDQYQNHGQYQYQTEEQCEQYDSQEGSDCSNDSTGYFQHENSFPRNTQRPVNYDYTQNNFSRQNQPQQADTWNNNQYQPRINDWSCPADNHQQTGYQQPQLIPHPGMHPQMQALFSHETPPNSFDKPCKPRRNYSPHDDFDFFSANFEEFPGQHPLEYFMRPYRHHAAQLVLQQPANISSIGQHWLGVAKKFQNMIHSNQIGPQLELLRNTELKIEDFMYDEKFCEFFTVFLLCFSYENFEKILKNMPPEH